MDPMIWIASALLLIYCTSSIMGQYRYWDMLDSYWDDITSVTGVIMAGVVVWYIFVTTTADMTAGEHATMAFLFAAFLGMLIWTTNCWRD